MSTSRIIANPKVMLGEPVIQGTRLTVELLSRKLAEGVSVADLQAMYPNLETADIQAAVAYSKTK